MPDIHILRPHSLGLPEARKAAILWAQKAEKKFDMECFYAEGEEQDNLHFSRSGIKGTLQVCADQFALDAQLGFLWGVFQERIESEIGAQLDKLLNTPTSTEAPTASPSSPPSALPSSPAPTTPCGGAAARHDRPA